MVTPLKEIVSTASKIRVEVKKEEKEPNLSLDENIMADTRGNTLSSVDNIHLEDNFED